MLQILIRFILIIVVASSGWYASAVASEFCQKVFQKTSALSFDKREDLFAEFRSSVFGTKSLYRSNVLSLRILSSIPLHEIPPDIREFVESQWLDLDRNPPILLNSVSRLEGQSYRCGECRVRFRTHLQAIGSLHFVDPFLDLFPMPAANSKFSRFFKSDRTLFEEELEARMRRQLNENPSSLRKVVRVNGVAVGIVKNSGEPSFLALRNVFNSEGILILAAGGVYSLPFGEDSFFMHFSRPESNRSELQVKPQSFLLNENSLENDLLWKRIDPNFSRRKFSNREVQKAAWTRILELIALATENSPYFQNSAKSDSLNPK